MTVDRGLALAAWASHERMVRAAMRASTLPVFLAALLDDLNAHPADWWQGTDLPPELLGRRLVLLDDLARHLAWRTGVQPNPADLLPPCPNSPDELAGGAP